ncbi:general transcription factor IIE subunit 1 [Eurytemora carolleeae]|uniref:general transcription factor IIE subunit 1 n=1 Tax=Eurytemora carolleeae TaxID=1294199 RepID=UPI000C792627|nr:general transcription factor IIE subunit 1 [Eurytemora carolleeae]|eukprot:XP_023323654.1 general transcription factor IIE subunit 1-like [Eurytemora affinis]
MSQPLLTEVPSSLKQLSRLVVRGFYEMEFCLIIDMLVRYPCLREDDLCDLLKFDKKVLRAKLQTLKTDRFVQVKLKIETGEDGKAVKVNCYFINYKIFVNIVKYKLDMMRKKMEVEERDATSRSSFKCGNCDKQFTDLEADQLFDPMSGEFKCTFCSCTVDEDETAMPKKESRKLLATFNEQMEKLFDLLRVVEDIKLSPEVLEPDPVDIAGSASLQRRTAAGPASGDMNDGKWSGESSRKGGFRMDDQQVNITFGEENTKQDKRKEVPLWISESTVETKEEEPVAMGPSMGMVVEEESMETNELDDEINNLLLKHERSNKQQTALIPGQEDSDSDNRSDESEPEDQDTVEREAILLAQTFANQENKDDIVDVMDSDDDDDDMPTVLVGGEEIVITDITPDIIAKMTTEEMERYNQVYQEFYKDMYD